MEKIIRIILSALSALTVIVGCRHVEQEVPETGSVKTVHFRAATTETRTAFTEAVDGVYQTLWTGNDSEILLSLNYAKAEGSAVTASADGKTATFAASFDAASTASPYTFYAVSPASAARAISPSRKAWSVYIAAEQTPSALSVDEGAQLLVAKSVATASLPDEVSLHFAHLTAYGRITLKNLELGEAKVYKADLVFDTPVVGEFYWGEDGTLTSNGASHTITLNTDASGDLWFACAPVSVGNTRMVLELYTDLGNLRKEITFPEGRAFASGKVARFSVDMAGIEIKAVSELFTLITANDQLSEGSEVVILDTDGNYAMGGQSANGNYRLAVSSGFTLSGKEVTISSADAAVFVVEAGTSPDTWSFKGEDGYLAAQSADKNYLKTQAEKDGYASWSLSFGENGDVTPKAEEGARNTLYFYPNDPRFSCYKSKYKAVKLYRKVGALPVEDDPLTLSTAFGSYMTGVERTYRPGSDQIHRSFDADGNLVFALLNPADKEQLVITGFDPALVKGNEVTVTASWRKGLNTLLKAQAYHLKVVKEDGSKVWLGDGTGQGFIIKK